MWVKGPGEGGQARPPQEQGFDCECSEGRRNARRGMWTQTSLIEKGDRRNDLGRE